MRDGADIPFTVTGAGDVVTFSYDVELHTLDIAVIPTEPVDDAALVRDPVRHPFVDEVLYFTHARPVQRRRRDEQLRRTGTVRASPATRRRTC